MPAHLLEILVHVCAHTARSVKINHHQVQSPDLGQRQFVFAVNFCQDYRWIRTSRSLQEPSQGLKECTVIRACIQGPVLQEYFSRGVVDMHTTNAYTTFETTDHRSGSKQLSQEPPFPGALSYACFFFH